MLFDSNPLVDVGAIPGGLQGIAGPVDVPNLSAPEHKGIFGIKGTARDILGILGDSLLVGTGGNAIYAPGRQKERIGAAFQDFASNPMAAVERIAQAGDPQLAGQMYDRVVDNARQNKVLGIQQQKQSLDLENLYLDRARNMLRTAKDEQSFNAMLGTIQRQAASRGVDLSSYLPKTFNDNEAFVQAGLDLKDAMTIENTESNREHQRKMAEERLGVARLSASSADAARKEAADARREANKIRERGENRQQAKFFNDWLTGGKDKKGSSRVDKLKTKGTPGLKTYNPATGRLE